MTVFSTRVANRYSLVHALSDLRYKARQLPGPNDQQTPARAVNCQQDAGRHLQRLPRQSIVQTDLARCQVKPTRNQLACVKPLQQRFDQAVG